MFPLKNYFLTWESEKKIQTKDFETANLLSREELSSRFPSSHLRLIWRRQEIAFTHVLSLAWCWHLCSSSAYDFHNIVTEILKKKVNFQWSAPRKRQKEKKKKIIIKLSIRLRLGNDEWRQLIVEIKKQQIVNLFPIGMKLLVCSTSECSFGCLTSILMILIDIRKWPCNIFQKKSVSCVRSRWLQNCVLIVKQIGRNW